MQETDTLISMLKTVRSRYPSEDIPEPTALQLQATLNK